MSDVTGINWEDAFANAAYIPDGLTYPEGWAAKAARFRDGAAGELDVPYGDHPRERLDLFLPQHAPRGTVVFVHGGFWLAFDKSYWSHLAAGALAQEWAVALPGYTLAPEARISEITGQIGQAIASVATRLPGPIRLTGHSAGGHLVTRMVCDNSPLSAPVLDRIDRVVSISGVHDLRPLQLHSMNHKLRLTPAEAEAESPALLRPLPHVEVTAWVGAAERPEFIRQSALLSESWSTPDRPVPLIAEARRHHFDVIDGLCDPAHDLCRRLTET
ncbi:MULTISPECIES: alpha/beta hydrolase [unclassified Marinovum]